MQQRPVSFPGRKNALANAAIDPRLKSASIREILVFLRQCKASHEAASNAAARNYLDRREKQGRLIGAQGPSGRSAGWRLRRKIPLEPTLALETL